MSYPNVDPQPDFPSLERAILEKWEADSTFERSIAQRDPGVDGSNEFVFYDGPPFANGLPHYGHLLTGFVKDAVPRYRTMRGNRVERRFGWDCHGLPAEVKAEQELGISGHPEITRFGIDKFNEACRQSVLQYTDDWRAYVTRQARWVDFDNDYKTLDRDYMESVIWAFQQLWEKGLIYEANRVMPYSWGAETPLSNFEIRLDDATRPRQDPAITVAFDLHPQPGDPGPMKMLAWTTTPWTLPSNLGLIVGPDLDYAVMELDGEYYVLGASTVAAYEQQLGEATQHSVLTGRDLMGRTYEPLFSYFADRPDLYGFRVLGDDFVATDEGTGIVHMAPGFGEDDQRIGDEAGMGMVVPVDDSGRFTDEVSDFAGMNVFDANPEVIRWLKDAGRLVRHDTYEHNYPHCWRTHTPIIYRAMPSWYVKVTDIRDRLVELNQQINWVPENIRDGRFGKWLEGARDWSISRNRFWGSPIPVWRSDDPAYPRIDVYGSLDQIEADFGVRPDDLHRPFIDELTRPNPDDPTGNSTMRRVPEVLDCWFESGSMPFAQVHYPFENADWFEHHYPGDFIVEYIGQTRGWFYTLHVLATALFDRPAFSTCVSHGIVLGDDGQKMSKSLNNYPDPVEMFDRHGADAMRWHLLSSAILRGSDGMVTEAGMRETVRQVLLPLWNTWYFLSLYSNASGRTGTVRTDSENVLDRYVMAKTRDLIGDLTESMDEYDLFASCQRVREYLDVLTNWYVRRSRARFWEGDADAVDTLHTVLEVFSRLTAPLLPFISEAIHEGLVGAASEPFDSVHLTDWPTIDELPADDDLVAAMDLARDVCSSTLSVRKAHQRRVRLPLSSLTVATPDAERLARFTDLIADEVNVKEVSLTSDVGSIAEEELKLVPAKLGPRLGKDVQAVIKAHKAGDWSVSGDGADRVVVVGGHELQDGEYELEQVAAADVASVSLSSHAGVVALDIDVTDDLEVEGRARDLIRLVQQARRDADLHVSDRISLEVTASEPWIQAIETHRDLVAGETLAVELDSRVDDQADDPIVIVRAVVGAVD
ncbi:MAG: isoleucine--tRNA ligase [Actinomycetota bacterium]